MKKIILTITLFISSISTALADDHLTTYAMEALQCDFAERKDMDDVMDVLEGWKELADDNSWPYSAWTLTPLYYSESDTPFDFGWMGYTQNMQELGKVQDSFAEVAQETFAKWQKTTDCAGQSLFRVIEARAPQSAFYQDQVAYMSISSCSIIDGKSSDDLAENDKVWNKYNDENGFTGGVYRWWPAVGAPTDLDFDFYLAIGYESVEQLGRARDIRMSRMMDGTRPEGILDCDTPRVYTTQNIRLAEPEES